jgi:hypothetical protein
MGLLPHLILAWPRFPESALGWLALLFLPVPLYVVRDWLFEYREIYILRWLNTFGDRIDRSKYRLVIIVTLLIIIYALCYVAILNFGNLLP